MKLVKYILFFVVISIGVFFIKLTILHAGIKSSCNQIMSEFVEQGVFTSTPSLVDTTSSFNPFFTKGTLPYKNKFGIEKDVFCAFNDSENKWIGMWLRPNQSGAPNMQIEHKTGKHYLLWLETKSRPQEAVHLDDLEVLWPLGND